jgi:ADP-heptose:LPS heptosyltransferase
LVSGGRAKILEMIERRSGRGAAHAPVRFGAVLDEPKKILVVPSRGAKGFPFAIPSLALLRERFPHAALHVLADSESCDVFRSDAHVDAVHTLPPGGSLLGIRGVVVFGKALAREEFDITLWLDDEVDPERRLAVLLASGKARIGRGDSDEFFNCRFRFAEAHEYPPLAQMALTRRVVRSEGTDEARWHLDEKRHERARQTAHFWKPRREDYLFAVDPGRGVAGSGPSTDSLRAIVELLRKTYPCKVLIASEPASAAAVRELAEGTARWDPILIPQTSLADTGALLSQADLLVSGNTALFHFAWVLGVPALGLFGRVDSERYVPPPGGPAVVIRSREGLEPQGFLERVNILLTSFPRERPRTR